MNPIHMTSSAVVTVVRHHPLLPWSMRQCQVQAFHPLSLKGSAMMWFKVDLHYEDVSLS
jgi:hypothetical protein